VNETERAEVKEIENECSQLDGIFKALHMTFEEISEKQSNLSDEMERCKRVCDKHLDTAKHADARYKTMLTEERRNLDALKQLDSEQELEHKQRCGAVRKFEMEHYVDSRKIIENLKKELQGYAEMTDAIMPTEEELIEVSEQFEVLILHRREIGQEAVRQCAETLALQLEYLKSPGIALGVLIQRIAAQGRTV
jgi:hypothetical protein